MSLSLYHKDLVLFSLILCSSFLVLGQCKGVVLGCNLSEGLSQALVLDLVLVLNWFSPLSLS